MSLGAFVIRWCYDLMLIRFADRGKFPQMEFPPFSVDRSVDNSDVGFLG